MEGQSMWIGAPRAVSEHASRVDPSQAPSWASFPQSALQCAPLCRDWGDVPALHVQHAILIPDRQVAVQAIDCECAMDDPSAYSSALESVTARRGDVAFNCSGGVCGPPNGVVEIADVPAILDKFRNLIGSPSKVRCDLEPATPDNMINISDVTVCLDAFSGNVYPFVPDVDPCLP